MGLRCPWTVGWLALGAASLCGCYASHERGDGRVPPAVRADAGTPDDAGASHDAGDAGDAGRACPASERRIRVSVERIGSAGCEGRRLEGMLTRFAPIPELDGIRIDVDLCPGVDEDCRCAIVVENVGADIPAHVGVVEGPFEATVSPGGITLRASIEGGEAGTYPDELALHAEDVEISPEHILPGLVITSDELCRTPTGSSPAGPCHEIGYILRVHVNVTIAGWPSWTDDGFVDVVEGETVAIPGTFVVARVIRAHEELCAPEGSPEPPPPAAAVVLWWEYPPAP